MYSTSEKSILVPVGATSKAMIAISQSYGLARLTKSKIVLLGVETSHHPFDQKRFDAIVDDVKEKSGVRVETMIRSGNIYDEITKVANVLNPMFIIMGISQNLSVDKIIGKNAFKMVRESKHAVITIKGDVHREGCKHILLPLDLTRETREKVERSVELAKLFNSEIHIISILEHENKMEENKLHAYTNQAMKYIKDHGIKCTEKTMIGKDVPKMVIDYGHEINADLIVIMSQEKLQLSDLFTVGTVAQRVINESDIPVLSFRPMPRKDTTIGVGTGAY
jgi:nucleotide-binding universal stress UspA family protein